MQPAQHISVESQKKSSALSVTCVAVSVATLIIIVAVIIILVVTLNSSLKAADEFAASYSQNSISAAQNKVNDFVTIPVNAFTNMKIGTDYGILPKIIGVNNSQVRTDMYLTYLSHFQPMLFGSGFQLLYVACGLADKSWIACSVRNQVTREHNCNYINGTNSTTITYNANGNIITYRVATSTYDPRTRPWYIGAPKNFGDQAIFSSVYVDSGFAVPVVDINGPLFAKDGTFMGVTSITLDLRQIATFLAGMPRTANGFSALIDKEGFLLGASDLGALSETTPYNLSLDGPLPPGCGQYTNSTSGTTSKVCRLSPATYSSPILRELASKEPGVFASDQASFTRKVRLGGEQWMVSKAAISARTDVTQAAISWHIYTLMPVSDVTGPIISGRNAGIAVACVMVVVSCVACGVALFVLLRPLSVLSALMEQAAELKDDSLGATMDKSSMREIRAIQDSFERLSAQLKKAKSFLPASLLAQLESGSDDDNDGDETTLKGPVSVSYANSTQDAKTNASSTHRKSKAADTFSQATARTALSLSIAAKKTIVSNISLANRSVTVAVLNLRHFHRNTLEHPAGLEASYGRLVDEYQRVAKEHRGIMDSFHGDRFTFTFNTVRPCAAHASMGATAMLRLVGGMEQQQHAASASSVLGSAVTCGVATGRCLVGNLGSDKAKRYTVIGPAFSHATVLERLCKRYPNTSVLLSGETAKDSEAHVGLLYMDVIDGPGRKAVPVAAAKYVKETHTNADSEWMYEMATTSQACDYHAGNTAFLCALKGDAAGAMANLSSFTDTSDESEWARESISKLLRSSHTSQLGVFYESCILNSDEKDLRHSDVRNHPVPTQNQ